MTWWFIPVFPVPFGCFVASLGRGEVGNRYIIRHASSPPCIERANASLLLSVATLEMEDRNRSQHPYDPLLKPWKHIGYRGYCDFLETDTELLILRRFGALSTRVLLALQDELVELESQLDRLEDTLARSDGPDWHNGSFRQETNETRLVLVREIDSKLRAYSWSSIHPRRGRRHANLT